VDFSFAPDSTWTLTLGGNAEGIRDQSGGGATYYGDTLVPADRFQTRPAGRFGALWLPRAEWSVFANAGWYHHPPGLIDLYGGRWGMVANPELRAERGFNAEAGFRRRWKSGFAELCLFRNQIENAIFHVRAANLSKPFNLDATLAQGLEMTMDQTLILGSGMSYTATFRNTENQSDTFYQGLDLPNEPAYHHGLKTRFPLPGKCRLEYTWDFRTALFRDPGNIQRIPSQHLHHALLRWNPDPRFGASLSLQNLADAYYEDAYSSFPYPGRQFHVTLTANL
jgi:outer membrane receptor protein involved in Fe transport